MYKNFWRNFLNASPMTFLHPTFLPPPYKLNIQFRWKKSYNPSKMDTYLNFNFLKNKIKKSKITKSYNFIFSSFFFSGSVASSMRSESPGSSVMSPMQQLEHYQLAASCQNPRYSTIGRPGRGLYHNHPHLHAGHPHAAAAASNR